MSLTLFEKIINKEIPAEIIYEDDVSIVIEDINPQAPVHILVIPKGSYVDWSDFTCNASDAEQNAFVKMIGHVASLAGIADSGYRVICNSGSDGHQEVPHMHMHVLGGAAIGPLVSRR